MGLSVDKQIEKQEKRLQLAQMKRMEELLQSLPRFAKDEDESEWQSLSAGKRIYTEQDISDMQERAMELYYTDPSARGVIDTMVNFTLGKDAHVTPVDENPKVKAWWEEFKDVNKWDKRMRELVKRTFRDGESFLRFFKNKRQRGVPLVRFVEPDKITDPNHKHSFGIETDPEDVEDIKRYFLKNGKRIRAQDMIHTKINVDSNVKRGVSFLVGIAKYIVKYGGWLDDRIVLNKIRTMFNLIMKVTGISPEAAGEKFEDTVGKTGIGQTAKKRMPKSGSVLVSTPGIDYEFKNLNVHAQDTGADGRLIELQVAKGTNLTEYVVRADSSNSNYSSTMVSESPMVRMFESWQDTFAEPLKAIFAEVIRRGKIARKVPRGASDKCSVNFAALIHRDIEKETNAYVLQILNRVVSKRTVSEKFGYNYEHEQKQIEKEEEEEANQGFETRGNEED